MTFRDREKARYLQLKGELFSPAAQVPGSYRGSARAFCLDEGRSDENLHAGIRDAATAYFAERKIPWHDGASGRTRPSNTSAARNRAVSTSFSLTDEPHFVTQVFRHVCPEMAAALSIDSRCEPPLATGKLPCAALEWIGEADHLSQWRRKRDPAAADAEIGTWLSRVVVRRGDIELLVAAILLLDMPAQGATGTSDGAGDVPRWPDLAGEIRPEKGPKRADNRPKCRVGRAKPDRKVYSDQDARMPILLAERTPIT